MMPGPDRVLACPSCAAPLRCRSLLSGNTFGAVVWTDGWCDAGMHPFLPPLVSRCPACQRFFWVGRAERLGELDSGFSMEREAVTVVTLRSVGKRRAEVMHLVRRVMGGNLQEVKRRIDALPLELGRYFRRSEVQELTARFEALGAQVELREETEAVRRSKTPAEWVAAPRIEHPDEAGYLEALSQELAKERDEERELRLQAWWAGNAPYREGTPWLPFSRRAPGARDNLRALVALCSPDDATRRLLKAEALRELERFDEARAVLSGEFPTPLHPAAAFLRELAAQRIAEVRRLPVQAAPDRA